MSDDRSELQTRPSLLLRIRDARDAEAWQTFVEVYAPLIYGFCRHRRLQEADAADVAQEVLGRVARSMRNFEYSPDRGRFRDWLGTVTRNEITRFLRRASRPGQGTGGDESNEIDRVPSQEQDPEWAEQFHSHVLQTALERIRASFETNTWRAFELVWLHDRQAKEAASDLGEPIEMIYVAKSRVLKRLREEVLRLAEEIPQIAAVT